MGLGSALSSSIAACVNYLLFKQHDAIMRISNSMTGQHLAEMLSLLL